MLMGSEVVAKGSGSIFISCSLLSLSNGMEILCESLGGELTRRQQGPRIEPEGLAFEDSQFSCDSCKGQDS